MISGVQKCELPNLLHNVPFPYLTFGPNKLLTNQIKSCISHGNYSIFGIKNVTNRTKSKYYYKTFRYLIIY